jgi:non-ribosomal peptide synthase protein (TIGR01720 family)
MVYVGRRDDQVKYHGFRVELGEIRASLNQHPLVRNSFVTMRTDHGEAVLVGFYAAARNLASSELRQFLADRLPKEIIPNYFVHLPEIPLTVNGKVDQRALPSLDEIRKQLGGGAVAPRTDIEIALSNLWSAVLGVGQIGIYDNFFELGGDSILSLQIAAKAARLGLRLTPADIFRHPTVAQLAKCAVRIGPGKRWDEATPGPIPLTPVQHWFFDQDLADPHHFNQSLLLEFRETLEPEILERVWQELRRRHAALRLAFTRHEPGWKQSCALEPSGRIVINADLSRLAPARQREAMYSIARRQQASLSLNDGQLLRVVRFNFGPAQERLLIIIHHLAVDAVSWRVLLEDLQDGIQTARGGVAAAFESKSSPFQNWAAWLIAEAKSESVISELPHWRGIKSAAVKLPVDQTHGPNIVASASSVVTSLTSAQTSPLLRYASGKARTAVQDALLAALGRTLGRWMRADSCLIDVEGHGREIEEGELDIWRTVGWFTSIYPVSLTFVADPNPNKWLEQVAADLGGVRRGGIGYGLLRYLNSHTAPELARLPAAEIGFNYLGQVDSALPRSRAFDFSADSPGPSRSPRGLRRYVIEVEVKVERGRLRIDWIYSANLHRRETIQAYADQFRADLEEIISYCVAVSQPAATPEYPLSGLDSSEIRALLEKEPDLEDVYRLAPMQEGMLYHALQASSAYLLQFSCRLAATLDIGLFRKAWEIVVSRHAILRTRFAWERLRSPVQVVSRQVTLDWTEVDLRGCSEEESERNWATLRRRDYESGIDPARSPVMRWSLLRLRGGDYQFLATTHHLLLDGWSTQLLLREVLDTYRDCRDGHAVSSSPACAYGTYIGWLAQQNPSMAEAYWRGQMAGIRSATPLPHNPKSISENHARHSAHLSEAVSQALRQLARGHRVSLNAVVQGAWAMVLAGASGADDVLFGVTVAGRPAGLAGMESILGPFINTVPARVKIDREAALGPWLRLLQERQAEMRQFEYCSLAQIQGWSEAPPGTPLFHSVVVFENYPTDRHLLSESRDAGVSDFEILSSGHSLAVVATPGQRLGLEIWDDRAAGGGGGAQLLRIFVRVLECCAAHPEATLDELAGAVEELRVCSAERHIESFRAARRSRLTPFAPAEGTNTGGLIAQEDI